MSRTLKRLQSLGAKVGAFALSGVLACSLTPALALAETGTGLEATGTNLTAQHYEYKNNTGKLVADTLNQGVERVDSTDGDNIYQYRGYVHSDGSHYAPYSLYTEIATNSDGVVTAIDLTSGNDMWAGKWGKYASDNSVTVDGYLPDGVNFNAVQNSDGTWTPLLTGAGAYDVTTPVVTFISTNEDGTADALGVDQSTKVKSTGTVSAAAASDGKKDKGGRGGDSAAPASKFTSNPGSISGDGKITVPSTVSDVVTKDSNGSPVSVNDANYYNLVKCAYTFTLKGNSEDKATFNTYFTVGSHSVDADQYINNAIGKTEWSDEAVDETNRDGWTGITGTLALRMLGSWNAWLRDSSVSTDLGGDLASVDTVSGATKTSRIFVNALNQARSDGYINGVAENVQVTIDKNDAAINKAGKSIDINATPQDGTTVTENADGTYTVNAHHRLYGGGRLSLLNVYLYDLNGQTVGTTGMKTLAKEAYYDTGAADGDSTYRYLKSYNSSDLYTTKPDDVKKMVVWNDGADSKKTVPLNSSATLTYGVGDSDDYISLEYTNNVSGNSGNDMPLTLTTKNNASGKKVTHVVFKYLLGHATFSMAYDLKEMSKVPNASATLHSLTTTSSAEDVQKARATYNALKYDVRPFVGGLDNLIAQEARVSIAKKAADLSSFDAAKSAEAAQQIVDAYDSLTDAEKQNVGSEAVSAVLNAQKVLVSKANSEALASKGEATAAKSEAAAAKSEAAAAKREAAAAKSEAAAAKSAAANAIKANTMTVSTKTITAKAKKKTSFAASKAFTVKDAQGAVKYYKTSGSAKVKVSASGKVTVAKGLKKKKTVKANVLVVAEGNASYAPVAKTVTLKVKVK